MFKQCDVLNKEIYLVFECVYYEDGIYPEYAFSGAFFDSSDASIYFNSLKNKPYKISNKMFKQKIEFDQTMTPLFWNQEFESWTDKGCFMSVTLDDILNNLNKCPPNVIDSV